MNFCNFIQQRLQADGFQIPPHRQALSLWARLRNDTADRHKNQRQIVSTGICDGVKIKYGVRKHSMDRMPINDTDVRIIN